MNKAEIKKFLRSNGINKIQVAPGTYKRLGNASTIECFNTAIKLGYK